MKKSEQRLIQQQLLYKKYRKNARYICFTILFFFTGALIGYHTFSNESVTIYFLLIVLGVLLFKCIIDLTEDA